jgi:transaldolase
VATRRIDMKDNPLLKLESYGQSIWLDFIHRGMLTTGELARLIEEDGLSGVTSNPAIFEKAIDQTGDYEAAIRTLARAGKSATEIYEELAVEDVRMTADLFRPLFERKNGTDGFISLEVSPRLAHDTVGTIQEARRFWKRVDRPNLFIKVPGTSEGLPAIRQLLSEGINVNVTLLFGLPRYRAVVEAYLDGMEAAAAQGYALKGISSVASFFLSRIDVLIDPLLEKKSAEKSRVSEVARSLRGEVAIASAKIAYQMWKEMMAGERFQRLAARGARPQRVLWASTGTKNPAYSDVKYLEALIGPETVNTVPLETLKAYRDHGNPDLRLELGVDDAGRCLRRLTEVGIDLDAVTGQLEDEAVIKFVKPFDSLMKTLEEKRIAAQE